MGVLMCLTKHKSTETNVFLPLFFTFLTGKEITITKSEKHKTRKQPYTNIYMYCFNRPTYLIYCLSG